MTDPASLPKWMQISEMLIREIAAGHRVDGARLPPEREMAAGLGISVGTLRKALSDLEARGLLERRHGSGNYIRSAGQSHGVYALFRLEAVAGGGLPTAEFLDVARQRKPEAAPDFGPSGEAHRIRRLRRLDGVPAAVEEIWLDGARAEFLRPRDLKESLYLFYRDSLGFWIAQAEDRVFTAAVPRWSPAAFGPKPGEVTGYIERVARDQAGAPCEYSRTWFDGAVARYVARLG